MALLSRLCTMCACFEGHVLHWMFHGNEPMSAFDGGCVLQHNAVSVPLATLTRLWQRHGCTTCSSFAGIQAKRIRRTGPASGHQPTKYRRASTWSQTSWTSRRGPKKQTSAGPRMTSVLLRGRTHTRTNHAGFQCFEKLCSVPRVEWWSVPVFCFEKLCSVPRVEWWG